MAEKGVTFLTYSLKYGKSLFGDRGQKYIYIERNISTQKELYLHRSINKIYENKISSVELEFQEITEEFIHKQINKINIKKATGKDGISAKMLKLAEPVIAKPVSNMINKSLKSYY